MKHTSMKLMYTPLQSLIWKQPKFHVWIIYTIYIKEIIIMLHLPMLCVLVHHATSKQTHIMLSIIRRPMRFTRPSLARATAWLEQSDSKEGAGNGCNSKCNKIDGHACLLIVSALKQWKRFCLEAYITSYRKCLV
jgi:hypothetical protein